jgi:5-methylcytosine-specific restriction protein A
LTPLRPDRRSPEAAAWRHLYSTKAWRELRADQLRRQPLCEECRSARKVTPATVANHRTPHKGDLTLFFDRANLQSVCKPHHDGPIQAAEASGFAHTVDAAGYPIDPRHPANRHSAA